MKMACTDALSVQDAENKGGFAGRDCTANKQIQIHITKSYPQSRHAAILLTPDFHEN